METKSVDPEDIGPCYDGCGCDLCWKGWTTKSVKDRVLNRIEYIIYNDIEVEHITHELAHLKLSEVMIYFNNHMREALVEACSIGEVYANTISENLAGISSTTKNQEVRDKALEMTFKDLNRLKELRNRGRNE